MRRTIAVLFTLAVLITANSLADEYYVLCSPRSEVNVRLHPKKSEIIACVVFGKKVESNRKRQNGYIHVEGLAAETTSGWIYSGYLIDDEPVQCDLKARIVSNGRVACRKCVAGKVIRWLQNGSEVEIYAVSEEWCVTDKGYIKREFIEIQEQKDGS